MSEQQQLENRKRCVICHVRLRPETMPLTYCAGDIDIKEGEWVVVPTDHGIEVGQVVGKPITLELPEKSIPPFVERLATTSEIEDYYKNIEFEQSSWATCQELIDKLGLKMKLIRVECFFDKSKIIFFYSADGRVDFRELVKELVKRLRMRVEMRQIGIRHEAKLVGGIGCCGREICCTSFLTTFDSISIKMAKTQNLPLNPNKISGLCGRLLCCLTYEYETYKEMSQSLPSLGKACETPSGQGKVIRQNIFRQAVTVAMPDGSIVEYTIDELEGKKKEPKKDEFSLGKFGLDEIEAEEEDERAEKHKIEEKDVSEPIKREEKQQPRQKACAKRDKKKRTQKQKSKKQRASKKKETGKKALNKKRKKEQDRDRNGKG